MKSFKKLMSSSLNELKMPRNMVLCSIMAAISIILGTMATINIGQYIKIGFSDLPNRIVDYLFGPIAGTLYGGALDIFKYILNPTGPYFFGFTFNAMLTGFIVGIILYKKKLSLTRIIIVQILLKLVINCGLNTLWLSILYGKGFIVLLVPRIVKNLIMLPIDCIILWIVLNFVYKKMHMFHFFSNQYKR